MEWSAHRNHRENSARIIHFKHPRDSGVFAHAGPVIFGRVPIEVRGAVYDQSLTVLLEHCSFRMETAAVSRLRLSPGPGSPPKTRIRASAGSFELTSRT